MKPRVLFVTPRFPFPPDRGDRLHAYHLIRVLSARFAVTAASFAAPADARAEGTRLFGGWGVRSEVVKLPLAGRLARLAGGALFSADPLQVAYYDEPAMRRALVALSREGGPFDALVCHFIRTVPLARSVPARVRVISLCDSLRLGLDRRLAYAPWLERPSVWFEARRVGRYEAAVLEGFDEGWVVSEIDRAAFGESAGKIVVIPNGVDGSLFEGDVPAEAPPVVGFLGHLGVPHNVDASVFLVRRIMPLVWARGVAARVRLIGPDPAPAVRALASEPRVELSGFASHLRPALQGLRVMCAPLRFSAGLQNKLIEAVAAGVPTVSSASAVAALGSQASRWIRVGHDPESYAAEIEAAWVRSPNQVGALRQAREWARSSFRWEAFADRLTALIAGAPPGSRAETRAGHGSCAGSGGTAAVSPD